MTESGANSTNLWSVPQCPFPIETSARVLDDIRLTVVDAFFSLPRGGAEIGGILLGTYHSGRLAITGYAALDCEHAFGPSFTLSPPDEARLKTLLAQHAGGAGGMRPVGWYHSHTRSEIFLSDADLEIHKRYFPEPWQVALVIKPHTFQPARFGFFFREADGRMQAKASYREVTLEALPLRQVPGRVPSAAPADQPPLRRWQPEPPPADRENELRPLPALTGSMAAAPQPAPDPNPEPDPDPEPPAEPAVSLPVPQFLHPAAASSQHWTWVLAIGIAFGVAAATFQTRQAWLPKVVAAVKPAVNIPPPPALRLNAIDHDGQLQINWDRDSRALPQARDAMLEIADGPSLKVIQLDDAHLRAGSFTYAREAEKVDIQLIVHQVNAPDVREVTSFLGKLPERQPAEDPELQKQRDELAKQAAKLKVDLDWQTLKAKKLEKDLKSMREEIKHEQMKRLHNQVPDK
jgi:proteasome lid subunit RPN8/RPN11